MTHRDEFSRHVKLLLAKRAGYRCSVCGKATIGPATDPDRALSDGMAAHITAAAANGPRYDASLTSQQRSSAANGIWVCRMHGNEIDADTPGYSVAVLRGSKRIREEVARKELRLPSGQTDATAGLIELPHADNAYTLFALVENQPYVYPTTGALREQIRIAKEPPRILDLATQIIIEAWQPHPDVAGILSTLVSNNFDLWQPTDRTLRKLRALCEAEIRNDDWTRVAIAEPAAFALAAKGYPDVHNRILARLVENPKWRDADASRIRQYYGSVGVEMAAIIRHWQDQFRKGLLRAHDVSRVMDTLLSVNVTHGDRPAYRQLLEILRQQAQILAQHGEEHLAREIDAFFNSVQESHRIGRSRGSTLDS
jgi:hypothetical protein